MERFANLSSANQILVRNDICKMLSEGLGYKKSRRALALRNISISLSTLSYWCNTETKRLRKNSFEPKSSKELAYFIGTMFGDGSATADKTNHDYCLQLSSIDREFVEKFSLCVSKLLGKEKSYPVHKCKSIFNANIRCKELYTFVKEIKNDFGKAKPFIENFPAEFIQGLADSEGCPGIVAKNKFSVRVQVANSANLELLQYTQDLLIRFFSIKSTSKLTKKAGMSDSIIEGRVITRTKNLYLLEISAFADVCKYFELIDFSIIRKHKKLEDAIKIKKSFSGNKQVVAWRKIYYKVGKQWKLKPVQQFVS